MAGKLSGGRKPFGADPPQGKSLPTSYTMLHVTDNFDTVRDCPSDVGSQGSRGSVSPRPKTKPAIHNYKERTQKDEKSKFKEPGYGNRYQ